jgi:DNA-directed RNA polymerase specialized sigma24 family protein
MDDQKPTYDELSDKQLILRYCANRDEDGLASELWRRHKESIYEALKRHSRRLCPSFWDQEDLAHDSYMQVRKNVLNRICEFKGLDSARSLKAWLDAVAKSTLLDERRKVTGRGPEPREFIEVPYDDAEGEEHLVEPAEPPVLRDAKAVDSAREFGVFEPRSRHLFFRSAYSTNPLDPVAPVEQDILERERRFIFRDILVRRTRNSEKDAQCSSVIRLRYWRKWPVKKTVEFFYGAWATNREFNTKYQACRRLLKEDYDAILLELDRTLRVKRPEQI